ncbi:hypothetical protein SKAU_G00347940 [Synaphobranchus kaupii]|uniref:Uncharacterized protein n=1 Tax=Synaphobranchus kaupii TaxID=118154 RepID=A0A9Q1EJW6_SYNKA|nr:hypothetical protein SKAU_G00347940 [Synaphobranchus kaupii]
MGEGGGAETADDRALISGSLNPTPLIACPSALWHARAPPHPTPTGARQHAGSPFTSLSPNCTSIVSMGLKRLQVKAANPVAMDSVRLACHHARSAMQASPGWGAGPLLAPWVALTVEKRRQPASLKSGPIPTARPAQHQDHNAAGVPIQDFTKEE